MKLLAENVSTCDYFITREAKQYRFKTYRHIVISEAAKQASTKFGSEFKTYLNELFDITNGNGQDNEQAIADSKKEINDVINAHRAELAWIIEDYITKITDHLTRD